MADPAITIKLQGYGTDSAAAAAEKPAGVAPAPAVTPQPTPKKEAEPEKKNLVDSARDMFSTVTRTVRDIGFVLGHDTGQVIGAIGRIERGKALYDQFFQRQAEEKPKEYPEVHPATMGDIMAGHPDVGRGQPIHAETGTPIVEPAGMGDIMGLPHGTATAVGGEAAAEGAGGVMGTGMGLGPMAAIAGAVVMSVRNMYQGYSRAAKGSNDYTEIVSGGLQAVLGPIIGPIISGVADKVFQKMGDAIRLPAVIAEKTSAIVGTAAGGNNAKAMSMLYDTTMDVVEELPIFGHQIALVGETAGRVVGAFNDVVGAFIERGRQLSGYSGGLAASYAIGDVRMLLADIDEANRLDAAGLSKLNDGWVELSLLLREMLMPIKEWLVSKLADLLGWLVEFVKTVPTMINGVIHAVESGINDVINGVELAVNFLRILSDPDAQYINLKRAHLGALREFNEQAKAEQMDPMKMLDLWLNMARDLPANADEDDPNSVNIFGGGGLGGIPLLKG